MKRRELERVERRRTLVDLNLVSQARSGVQTSRRGCASLLSRALVDVVLAAALVALGLS